MVTALFWLSKPPYESRTKATLEQAVEEIRLFPPEMSARDFTAEYGAGCTFERALLTLQDEHVIGLAPRLENTSHHRD